MNEKDFVEITYKSEPIGREHIILEVRRLNFDKEVQKEIIDFQSDLDKVKYLQEKLNEELHKYYDKQIEELKYENARLKVRFENAREDVAAARNNAEESKLAFQCCNTEFNILAKNMVDASKGFYSSTIGIENYEPICTCFPDLTK